MEIWKAVFVAEYSATYEISNIGRVRNIKTGKIRKNVATADDKYFYLGLSNNGNKHNFYLHRLVALTFIGSPTGDRNQINHKDGNGKNNQVKNLEWVTQSENMRHRYRILGIKPIRGAAKLTDDQIIEMRRLRVENGATYKQLMKRFGICKSTVSYVINRKTWYHI